MDDLDTLCKQFTQCSKCSEFKYNSCDRLKALNFTIDFIPNTDTYTCDGGSQCSLDTCKCYGEFSLAVARHFVDNGLVMSDTFSTVKEEYCESGGPGNGFRKDSCCGESPHWQLYSISQFQCVNGYIRSY